MLVKELRQGLRTRSFIAVFLTLQALLGIILLSASALASSEHSGSSISNIIFTFFSIAVLVLQPMRGIGALSSEIKGNTIDMMVLTRLSAWRIVTGKWSAIVTQSALILVTIIPYLILRYFFGGMNLLGEIVLLGMIFISSATLSAITVGLSASTSIILRSFLPMIALPMGAFVILGMLSSSREIGQLIQFCALEEKESRIAIPLIIAACAYGGYFMLSAGTSLIATHAENHSTLRRIIALGITFIAAAICSSNFVDPEVVPFILIFIAAPAFAISLSEFAPPIAPVYENFSRRGPFGKAAAVLFLPGWPSGVFFCLLLTLVAFIPLLLNPPTVSYADDFKIGYLAVLGTMLFPAVILCLLKMKGPQRISNYLLLGISSCVIATVLAGLSDAVSNRDFLWLFVWLPPVQLAMITSSRFDSDAVFIAAAIIDAAFFALLLIFAQHQYRASLAEIGKSRAHETTEA